MTPRTYLSLWHGVQPWRPRLGLIAADVAERHGVTVETIRGPCRRYAVTAVRQAFMAEAHDAGHTLAHIGRFVGRHHATVLYGARVAKLRPVFVSAASP